MQYYVVMKFEQEIRSAIEHAAPLEWRDGSWVETSEPERELFTVPDDAPDDYPIIYPSRAEHQPLPHNVEVETLPDLTQAVLEYGYIAGVPISPDRLDASIALVSENAELTATLGGTSLYALRVFANNRERPNVKGWGVSEVPVGLETTVIGRALMAVYHREVSPDDIAFIGLLGYESVEQVGDIAAQYGLPRPLSISGDASQPPSMD
jgi:hypothetical protein